MKDSYLCIFTFLLGIDSRNLYTMGVVVTVSTEGLVLVISSLAFFFAVSSTCLSIPVTLPLLLTEFFRAFFYNVERTDVR
jgi:hypothetical protein